MFLILFDSFPFTFLAARESSGKRTGTCWITYNINLGQNEADGDRTCENLIHRLLVYAEIYPQNKRQFLDLLALAIVIIQAC